MLKRILKMHDLSEFEDEFESLKQPCWAGTAFKGNHLTGESKVGGVPDVPEDFVWPVVEDTPLEFICQIKCSDVTQQHFPDDGLMLFFVCLSHYSDKVEKRGFFRVIYVAQGRSLSPAVPPFIYKKRLFGLLKPQQFPMIYSEARLKMTNAISLPDSELLEEDFSKKMDDKDEWDGYYEVKEQISGERFIQIGGYPDPVQCDGIAQSAAEAFNKGDANDWHMILQVFHCQHTNMMWGDAGRLHFYAHAGDIKNLKFDEVWLEFQCH